MSAALLTIVSGIYFWVAFNYVAQGRVGLGVAFAAYALANAGFMLDGWGK